MASVIRDERRLSYFRQLLNSIRAQTRAPTRLYISIHIVLDLSSEEWSSLFANLPGNPVILKQRHPKRQFVQYRELLKRAAADLSGENTFILFSDDDDLWHPQRVACYLNWFDNMIQMGTPPDVISRMTSIQAREQTTPGLPCEVCQTNNSNDVDAMLRCGCVTIELLALEKGPMLLEYHQYAVRPRVLQEFLEKHVQLVETNRFADMEFRQFVRTYDDEKGCTGQLVPPHWMYFYRQCDPSYDAVTRPMNLVTDMEEAVQRLTEMVACPSMGRTAALKCIAKTDPSLWMHLLTHVKGLE